MLTIVTKQLSEILPKNHKLQKYTSIDPTNFKEMIKLLKSKINRTLCVYDVTNSKKIKEHQTVMIKDHINNIGFNILIGQQKHLNIDFIDLTNLYSYKQSEVITICCGKKLNLHTEYPSHYLCNITTLAKALQFKTIIGYLYNVRK